MFKYCISNSKGTERILYALQLNFQREGHDRRDLPSGSVSGWYSDWRRLNLSLSLSPSLAFSSAAGSVNWSRSRSPYKMRNARIVGDTVRTHLRNARALSDAPAARGGRTLVKVRISPVVYRWPVRPNRVRWMVDRIVNPQPPKLHTHAHAEIGIACVDRYRIILTTRTVSGNKACSTVRPAADINSSRVRVALFNPGQTYGSGRPYVRFYIQREHTNWFQVILVLFISRAWYNKFNIYIHIFIATINFKGENNLLYKYFIRDTVFFSFI